LLLIVHLLGFLTLALGTFMLPSLAISIYDGAPDMLGLALSSAICVLGGAAVAGLSRNYHGTLGLRDAFRVVTLSWFLAGVIGALPYYLSALLAPEIAVHFPSFVDCFFESVSGFSTTGCSILTDIEAVPRGLLFWRAMTHWLGGMGIVVLSIAILPLLGGGGMNLYKAEAPGGILPDKLAPRIAETARSMWWVYIILTGAQIVMLLIGGMSLFDSMAHTFATVATGGFSTKNASVAAFDSAFIDYTISFFMFLGGVNFFLHYQALRGKPKSYLKDSEFRFYTGITVVICLIILSDVARLYPADILRAVRDTVFTVISIMTTTGFATVDFELWPELSKFLLVCLMVIGGSAGSTAGGSKCLRVLIVFKAGVRELKRILHPSAIIPVRIGRRAIPDSAVASVLGFITCIIGLLVLSSGTLTAMGIDLMTAFTATVTCIFNVGPGLGDVGPTENFGFMPGMAKMILSFCMILGRLEVYTVLVLLIPDFYRK